jgi:hypothetical protein
MVANRKTVTALGLEIPVSIRLQADEIIEPADARPERRRG